MLPRLGDAPQAAEPRSFYDGKIINLIVSTSPGGATDVAGRLVSRHLGKYIPGYPNILAQNMAGAGGIVSANYLYNVAKPGWLDDFGGQSRQLPRTNGRPAGSKAGFPQAQLDR